MNISEKKAGARIRKAALACLVRSAAAGATGIPPGVMRSPLRGPRPVVAARQTAMYLSHVAFGLSLTEIGASYGRDRTTVRHACARIEDRRDDPAQDLALTALETALVAMARALFGQDQREGRA